MPSIFRRNTNIVPIQSQVEDARSQTEIVKSGYFSRQSFTIHGGAKAEPHSKTAFGQMKRWFNGDYELAETEKQDYKYFRNRIKNEHLSRSVFSGILEHYKFAQRNVKFPLGAFYNLRFSVLNTIVPAVSLLTAQQFSPLSFNTPLAIAGLFGINLLSYLAIKQQIRKQYYEQTGIIPRLADIAEARSNMNNGKMLSNLNVTGTSYARSAFEITKPVTINEFISTREMYFSLLNNRASDADALVNGLNGRADKGGIVDNGRFDLGAQKLANRIDRFHQEAPRSTLIMNAASVAYTGARMAVSGVWESMPLLGLNIGLFTFAGINFGKQHGKIYEYNLATIARTEQAAYLEQEQKLEEPEDVSANRHNRHLFEELPHMMDAAER
jgi:hypothetical protein